MSCQKVTIADLSVCPRYILPSNATVMDDLAIHGTWYYATLEFKSLKDAFKNSFNNTVISLPSKCYINPVKYFKIRNILKRPYTVKLVINHCGDDTYIELPKITNKVAGECNPSAPSVYPSLCTGAV